MTDHKGLPVAGYQPQSDDKVQIVNRNKEFEERLLRICDEMKSRADLYDGKFVAMAITHFQEGMMCLNRAVFQPGRIKLPEDTP